MRRLLILAAIALATSSCARNSAQGSIDSEVHKMCLQAKDYIGCIKAQSGQSNSIEVFNNPGTASARGNSCSAGYAYIGNGYCREVQCIDRTATSRGNDQIISGKKWRCKNEFFSTYSLNLGAEQTRGGNDSSCPAGEPKIGWTSTCEEPYEEPPKEDRTLGRWK